MEEARPTFVKSGIFAATTVGGIAWWIIAAVARVPHNEKFKELTAERDRMKLDLKADQDDALGTLQLRF